MHMKSLMEGRASCKNNFKTSLSKKNFANKKGQVTVFIILGIVLVISIALLILMKEEIVSFGTEVLSSEAGKVESYIESCINDIGEEALYLSGLQGGYIEVPERYVNDVTWNIALSDFLVVPLWANGNTVDRPSLNGEIKSQIDEFIEENVRDCLYQDEAFFESYDLVENSEVESDISFEDKYTAFKVRWNILVKDKSGETISEVIEHRADSEVPFKTLYETASLILDAEMNEMKLEDITQDLIALEHEKVPVNGVDLSCSKKRWNVHEAKDTLKEMLSVNIGNLKVKGSSFTEFDDNFPYYQNHYVWSVAGLNNEYSSAKRASVNFLGNSESVGDFDGDLDDLSIVFKFEENYPFTFQVSPREGNYMYSSQLGGYDLLKFLCLQQWKFSYDVIYPVMMQVRDEESGVSFQTGFTVNLISNYPNKGSSGSLIYSREDEVISSSTKQEEYCYDNSYTIPMTVLTNSLIDNNRTGVYSTDTLEDVNISYTCVKYRCEMGASEYNFEERGNVAGLTQLFPYCSGGIMRGEKEGYVEAWEYVSAVEGKEVELNLRPLLSFPLSKVKVIKHRLDVDNCNSLGSDLEPDRNGLCVEISDFEEEIDEGESALITLTLSESGRESYGVESEDESGDLAFNFLGQAGSFDSSEGGIHKEEFIISPDLMQEDGDYLGDAKVEILSGSDFEYSVSIIFTTEEELVGGYNGNWVIDSAALIEISESFSENYGADESVSEDVDEGVEEKELVFHVLELDPSDADYYLLLADLEYYSELIAEPGLVAIEE